MHGKNNEKQTGDKSVNTGKTKDEEEGEYIENGCEQPSDSDDSDEVTDTEATNPKKDLSQRPDHYKTMKAEVLVVHDCDKDKLKAMGLEFIRYTRPVDQFDRISMTRQDRYLYAWVRDKDGNELAFFVPKDEG